MKFSELFNSFFVFRAKSKTFLDHISVQKDESTLMYSLQLT